MRDALAPDNESPGEAAEGRFLAEILPSAPVSGAMVQSDASGKWWHWYCARCEGRSQRNRDRMLIELWMVSHWKTCA